MSVEAKGKKAGWTGRINEIVVARYHRNKYGRTLHNLFFKNIL